MFKFGTYAMYKGKEYRLISKTILNDIKYELIDNDGFKKKITIQELEEIYNISTWCEYKGWSEFQIVYENEENYYLCCSTTVISNTQLKELGFKFIEPGVYKMSVSKHEVDKIYEKKNNVDLN